MKFIDKLVENLFNKTKALKQKENAKVCAWQSKDLKQQLSEKLTFAKI